MCQRETGSHWKLCIMWTLIELVQKKKISTLKTKNEKALIWIVSVHKEKKFFHQNKYLWLVKPEIGSHTWSIINRETHCSLSSKASGICFTDRSCALEQKGAIMIFFSFSGIKRFILCKSQNLSLKLKNNQEGLVTLKMCLL